jgi:SAM-dependent methyltransferase
MSKMNPVETRIAQHFKPSRQFLYNKEVAHWWLNRANDAAHSRAYRKIAEFLEASYSRAPRVIVDYACGAGHLLALLSQRFPDAKLIGLDGSLFLLNETLKRLKGLPERCSSRISLIETRLPDLELLPGRADLVIFCFPNMSPFPDDAADGAESGLSEPDRMIARSLVCAEESGEEAGCDFDVPAAMLGLQQGRRISLNLRRLLIRGGICVRVEYATAQRHELAPFDLMRVSFEEGSLDMPVEGKMPEYWFRVLASSYFRSSVLEDVYQQTGDARDRNGGYLITVLRAI